MWDDDERNTKVFLKKDKYDHEKDIEYIPIWKSIKQYWDEEKEKMYCNNYNKNEYKFLNYNYNCNTIYEYISPYIEPEQFLVQEQETEQEIEQETEQELSLFDDNMMYKNIFYV
jgi:hypothetical protein